MFHYYQPTRPGHYPQEDLHTQFYWAQRALEELAQEEEEYSRQCAYEQEQALNEYYSLGLMDGRQEWYDQQHIA